MSPTRRDTLKAAGAAGALTMLGSHAVAQQSTEDGEDSPGASSLEEGEAGVRVGHFLAGAPAVNVRLVPQDGGTDSTDDSGLGGTDNTTDNGTDDGGLGGTNDTEDNESDTGGLGTENDSADNESSGVGGTNNTSENESDDEFFQLGDDNETEDNESDTGGLGGNNTTDNETDDGGLGGDAGSDTEDENTVAEDVGYGEVSEYTNLEAGTYTLEVVESSGSTSSDDEPALGGSENTTDTGTDNESEEDSVISLPDNLENDTPENDSGNESSGGGLGGNDTEDNESSFGGTNNTSGNESDDEAFQLGNDTEDNETDDGGLGGNNTTDNETDDGGLGGDTGTDSESEEVLYETEVTVGETFYTVALAGNFDEDDVQAIVLRDYDAAQVRLVHVSPDAPGVDVVAPDANMTLFDGVSFGTATEYVGVPPGSYSLAVQEEAQMNDGEEITTSDVELESGEAYSVYATGSPDGGEEEFELVVNQDGQNVSAGLGSDEAPGQQDDSPGASGGLGGGNDTSDNATDDSPGAGGEPGNGSEPGGGPAANGEDEEPGAGGPGADDDEPNGGGLGGNNSSDNASSEETETEESGLF